MARHSVKPLEISLHIRYIPVWINPCQRVVIEESLDSIIDRDDFSWILSRNELGDMIIVKV